MTASHLPPCDARVDLGELAHGQEVDRGEDRHQHDRHRETEPGDVPRHRVIQAVPVTDQPHLPLEADVRRIGSSRGSFRRHHSTLFRGPGATSMAILLTGSGNEKNSDLTPGAAGGATALPRAGAAAAATGRPGPRSPAARPGPRRPGARPGPQASSSPARAAMIQFCPRTAPARHAPTRRLTAHGPPGRIVRGGCPDSARHTAGTGRRVTLARFVVRTGKRTRFGESLRRVTAGALRSDALGRLGCPRRPAKKKNYHPAIASSCYSRLVYPAIMRGVRPLAPSRPPAARRLVPRLRRP